MSFHVGAFGIPRFWGLGISALGVEEFEGSGASKFGEQKWF